MHPLIGTPKIAQRQDRSPYSPLAVTMLLHFKCMASPYLPGAVDTWPRAQQRIVAAFTDAGLIEPADNGFQTTERGYRLAKRLQLAFESLMVEAGA